MMHKLRLNAFEDYIGQTWFGKGFDRVMDGLYKVTGIDLLVQSMDKTKYFNSMQWGDPEKNQREIKAVYGITLPLIIYGCVADPLMILAGGTAGVLALVHHHVHKPQKNKSFNSQ